MKIQSLRELRDEMKAVVCGDRSPPAHANAPVYESADAMMRLPTPENRKLLSLIAQKRPQAGASLALLCGRAESNLVEHLRGCKTLASSAWTTVMVAPRCQPDTTVFKKKRFTAIWHQDCCAGPVEPSL